MHMHLTFIIISSVGISYSVILKYWSERCQFGKIVLAMKNIACVTTTIILPFSHCCATVFSFILPYTAKLSRGKTFAVVHKTHYSLENFCGASGPCHYVLYTANDSRGKLSRLAEKP